MQHYEIIDNYISLKSIPTFRLHVPEGEEPSAFQHFAYVLDCITSLFLYHVPAIANRTLLITNDPNAESPICYKSAGIIILNTRPHLWCQIAYQFGHELCHFAIPATVSQNLRWFEESICELASLYFLRQIGHLWMQRNESLTTSSGGLYARSFIRYAEDTAANILMFDTKDTNVIRLLEADCYDRHRNRYLATLMLPIFIKYPETWKAVPYLSNINRASLAEALDAWLLESPPSSLPGLHQIRNLLLEGTADQ